LKDTLHLERFASYWGALAYFPFLSLVYLPSPEQRSEALLTGEVHVLANVAPQDVGLLEKEGMHLEQFPSLELSFLMLNRNGVFADPQLREAVWYALSTDYADAFGGGFLRASSQYGARGIFGYTAKDTPREKNLERALELRAKIPGDIFVDLDLPMGLEVLGEAIQQDLEKIDVFVTVQVLSPEALQDKIEEGSSEMYFFGWKYDLADSADFYEAVVHSEVGGFGGFNGVNYRDPDLDALIEEAGRELSVTGRRELLEAISQRLLQDKNILPLFESENVFAFRPEIRWRSRLDGQLFASEIIENVLE
jgi:peptide/nickel transport system substrate-binding protein